MNEREHNELMRKCLTSEVHWRAQTASLDGCKEMREWLNAAIRRVNVDSQIKGHELAAIKAKHGPGSTKYRNAAASHHAWRASSLRFANMAQERLNELTLVQSRIGNRRHRSDVVNARGEGKDAALARVQAHGERMANERSRYRWVLIQLAKGIETFERGDLTMRELVALLDELTVPDGSRLEGSAVRTLLDHNGSFSVTDVPNRDGVG